ncbi:hypothetical protein ACWF76_30260 [Streptomyces globisporus]
MFSIRSKRGERFVLAVVLIAAVLTGVLLVQGRRGLALVMAGAAVVAGPAVPALIFVDTGFSSPRHLLRDDSLR